MKKYVLALDEGTTSARAILFDKNSDIINKILVKSYLMELLAEYISLSQPQKVNLMSKSDICINDILSYIKENYGEIQND